jgi:uncharacterized alpha-E superfamily protein
MRSRVADSLYWMSRYLERAEHTTRLLDVNLNLMLDESAASSERRSQRVLDALGRPRDIEWMVEPYSLNSRVNDLVHECDSAAQSRELDPAPIKRLDEQKISLLSKRGASVTFQ